MDGINTGNKKPQGWRVFEIHIEIEKLGAQKKQKKGRAQKLGTEKTSTEKPLHSMDFDFEIRQSCCMFANTLSGSCKGGGGGIKPPLGPGFIDHSMTHAHTCVCCVRLKSVCVSSV